MNHPKLSSFSLLDFHEECHGSAPARWATVQEQAVLAERLGFEIFWLAEHHAPKPSLSPNPAVALAAIAQSTTRIGLGPAVSVLPLHPPRAAAEDYAMVHLVSGGRLRMGVGTGSQPDEFDALDITFGSRRAAFESALDEMRALWNGPSASAGQAASLFGFSAASLPPPPFYVATLSRDGAHRAGLAGDRLLTMIPPGLADLADVGLRLRAHREGLESAGHPPRDAAVAVFAVVVPTRDDLLQVTRPAVRRLAGSWFGVPEEERDGLLDVLLQGESCFFCTEAEVPERLARYASLGVRHLALISDFGGIATAVSQGTMRQICGALGSGPPSPRPSAGARDR